MALIQNQFDSYLLSYFSHPHVITGSYVGEFSRPAALLNLLFNRNIVGSISFSDSLPLRRDTASGNIPIINFHLGLFNDLMNIISHEKPLFIILDTDRSQGVLATTTEPVGEQE